MTTLTSVWRLIRTVRFGLGEWLALGAALAFAGASIFLRDPAVAFDPLAGSVIRLLPLALYSLGMMILRRETSVRVLAVRGDFLSAPNVAMLAFAALVATPLSHLFLFLSLRYGGLLVAVPAYSTQPLFSALLAIPIVRESFTRRIGAGIVVALLGITLLSYGQQHAVPFSGLWPLGLGFGLLTGLMWGFRNALGGRLLRDGLELFTWHGVTTTTTVAVLALVLALSGRLNQIDLASAPMGSFATLLTAGGLTAVGQYLIFAALKHTTIASASTLKSLDVAFTSVIAAALLEEEMSLVIGIAIILVFAGVTLVQLAKAPGRANE